MAVTIIPKNTNEVIKRLIALFVLVLNFPPKSVDILRERISTFGY